jgi:hypothetical protein
MHGLGFRFHRKVGNLPAGAAICALATPGARGLCHDIFVEPNDRPR